MDKLDESERDTIFKNSILSDYSKSSAITEKLSRDGEKPTYFIHYSFAIFLLATWSTMFSFAERYLIPKITTYIGHIMS